MKPVICKHSSTIKLQSMPLVVAPSLSSFVSSEASHAIPIVIFHVSCSILTSISIHPSFFHSFIHMKPSSSHLRSSPSLLIRCKEGSDEVKPFALCSLRSKPNPCRANPSRAFPSHSESLQQVKPQASHSLSHWSHLVFLVSVLIGFWHAHQISIFDPNSNFRFNLDQFFLKIWLNLIGEIEL